MHPHNPITNIKLAVEFLVRYRVPLGCKIASFKVKKSTKLWLLWSITKISSAGFTWGHLV